ncbi:unnamed protein product [Musa acuminata subsp. burmannicoides]
MLFLFSNISASEAARRTRVVQRRTWPSDGTKEQLLYTKEIVIHWNHCSSAETANPKQQLMPRNQLSRSTSETIPACCYLQGFLSSAKR